MSNNVIINRPELADRLDNDFELFSELTDLFFEDSESLLEKIDNAIKAGDCEGLRKSAHTLKGAVSNFSALAAYDAAFVLEQAGRDKKIEGADELFSKLQDEIKKVVGEMRLIIASGTI